jgi:hypothetical protein
MAKLESRTPMRRVTLPTGQSAKIPQQPANTKSSIVKDLDRRLDSKAKSRNDRDGRY